MARDFLGEYGPERSNSRPKQTEMYGADGDDGLRDQRDVMNYSPPSRVKTPTDPRGPGLHGDNCGPQGSQGYGYERKQSSGGPGIGGSVRMCGSQGKR